MRGYKLPLHDSHKWGKIGNFIVCKNCCCGDWSPRAAVQCDSSKAKLRPMEKTMTQTIEIYVPKGAGWEVVATQHDHLMDGTTADTQLLPIKPGVKVVTHIWTGRSVTLSYRPLTPTPENPND